MSDKGEHYSSYLLLILIPPFLCYPLTAHCSMHSALTFLPPPHSQMKPKLAQSKPLSETPEVSQYSILPRHCATILLYCSTVLLPYDLLCCTTAYPNQPNFVRLLTLIILKYRTFNVTICHVNLNELASELA